jgi:hypothetical protein
VQTPRAAVLPAVMPAVGGSGDVDAGPASHVAAILWPLATGAARGPQEPPLVALPIPFSADPSDQLGDTKAD